MHDGSAPPRMAEVSATHPGLANPVAVEEQRLQLWHPARLEERGQGRGSLVAHLVVVEVEHLQLLQPAALVGRAERPDQGDPLPTPCASLHFRLRKTS